jgi:hypothetical protein
MIPVARASTKPAETLPMSVETCSTPTDKIPREKPLQEHSRSCRASGARPAGPLTRPRGKAFATRREECPISWLQRLREPDRHTHRRSGATVGDSHESPKKRGESCLKPVKNAKHTSSLNAKHTHNTIHAAAAPAAHQSGPTKRHLEQGPPRSRGHAPSNEVRLARGSPPPSSGLRLARGSLTSAPAPARVYVHLML